MLGIDVSKDTLSCALLDTTSRQALWHKEVNNPAAGWKQLLRHTPQAAPWVLEPTGRYRQGVARAAREAGRDVRLAQPKKAQLFLKSVQRRACKEERAKKSVQRRACKAAPRRTNSMALLRCNRSGALRLVVRGNLA